MIFQGDLSKYHPADALMFMSQFSLNGVLSVAAGQRVLGVDHPQIDHHLLERWRMPDPLVGAVHRHHHWTEAATAPRLTTVVAFANHLSHILGGRSRPDDFDDREDIDALRHALGLSEAHQADLLEKVAMDCQNADLLG